MSELLEKRIRFTYAVAGLIEFVTTQGYQITLGPDGLKHMKNSLHYVGLAVDVQIFKDGVYLTKTPEYKFAGDWWKSLGPDFCWGGDWEDGNHFSITYGGRK